MIDHVQAFNRFGHRKRSTESLRDRITRSIRTGGSDKCFMVTVVQQRTLKFFQVFTELGVDFVD